MTMRDTRQYMTARDVRTFGSDDSSLENAMQSALRRLTYVDLTAYDLKDAKLLQASVSLRRMWDTEVCDPQGSVRATRFNRFVKLVDELYATALASDFQPLDLNGLSYPEPRGICSNVVDPDVRQLSNEPCDLDAPAARFNGSGTQRLSLTYQPDTDTWIFDTTVDNLQGQSKTCWHSGSLAISIPRDFELPLAVPIYHADAASRSHISASTQGEVLGIPCHLKFVSYGHCNGTVSFIEIAFSSAVDGDRFKDQLIITRSLPSQHKQESRAVLRSTAGTRAYLQTLQILPEFNPDDPLSRRLLRTHSAHQLKIAWSQAYNEVVASTALGNSNPSDLTREGFNILVSHAAYRVRDTASPAQQWLNAARLLAQQVVNGSRFDGTKPYQLGLSYDSEVRLLAFFRKFGL